MRDGEDTREVWFEHERTRLLAVERGAGEPLVFLHGGLADHHASARHLGALSSAYRLITPDVRGAGRSHFSGELSWELLADDVAALLQQLGLARAVVGGVSAGSAVALAFARRYPERVRALVLIWPVYAGQEAGLTPAQRLAMERMHEFGRRARSSGIEALYPVFDALPVDMRARALAMASSFDPASVEATTRFLASGVQPFRRMEELAVLSVPALIVPGLDPQHPADVAMRYARALPRDSLIEPTAEVARAIDTFLRALPNDG